MDQIGGMISPPKMAKVLEPRAAVVAAAVAGGAAPSDQGWIPLIEEKEWAAAPLSLKMQVLNSDLSAHLALIPIIPFYAIGI